MAQLSLCIERCRITSLSKTMIFWPLWYLAGLALTTTGMHLAALSAHAGGPILWVAQLLLPGIFVSGLMLSVLPEPIADSVGAMNLLSLIIQFAVWHCIGFFMRRILSAKRNS